VTSYLAANGSRVSYCTSLLRFVKKLKNTPHCFCLTLKCSNENFMSSSGLSKSTLIERKIKQQMIENCFYNINSLTFNRECLQIAHYHDSNTPIVIAVPRKTNSSQTHWKIMIKNLVKIKINEMCFSKLIWLNFILTRWYHFHLNL